MFLGIASTNNPDLSVRQATATLSVSPHHTEDWETGPVGGLVIHRVLRTLFLAHQLGRGLVPPSEHEAVALDIAPATWTVPSRGWAGAQTREIQGVGLRLNYHCQ